MFGCSLMEMWTMDICEGRSWSLYVPQSPVSWIVTGTCTHLMERGYLLLHFHDYLLSCVFAAIWQILRGGSHRLQSNQLKTRKIFLPQRGIEPRTFQSWVFCLAIWAITPRSDVRLFPIPTSGYRTSSSIASNRTSDRTGSKTGSKPVPKPV